MAASYITKNHLGIWQFQVRVPHPIKSTKSHFRKSTGTRDRAAALKIGRRWLIQLEDEWVMETQNLATKAVFSLPPTLTSDSLKLNDLATQFIAEKEDEVGAGTLDEYKKALTLFIDIMGLHGLTEAQELTRQSMKAYRSKLKLLPPHRKKKYPNHSLVELLKMKHKEKISPATLLKNVNCVSNWFAWMDEDDLMETSGLIRAIRSKGMSSTPVRERIPYSEDQARKLIIGHAHYLELKWATRIAAYTGARMREILCLEREDIREVNGILVIDINKCLKTEGSRGVVPVASQLLGIGLERWLEGCGAHPKLRPGAVKLFSEELTQSGYTRFSKAYQRFRKKMIGEAPNGKMVDFHSWRHTVRTKLSDAEVPIHIADMITRHKNRDVSEGERRYNHNSYLREMKEAVDQIKYDVDIGVILKSDTDFRGANSLY